jgi:hypothetical protein
MEHYFSLYGIIDELTKIRYGILYLYPELWQWWQLHRNACQWYVSWSQFVSKLCERFDTDTHHLGCLTKLKQYGIMEYFEHCDFQTEGMIGDFFRECFISGLKDETIS